VRGAVHDHPWGAPLRICFLFNHDQPHQVAHSLPIARAMAARGSHAVVLAVTHDAVEREVRRLLGTDLARVTIVSLRTKGLVRRSAARLLDPLFPARRLAIYRDNLDFFRGFDVLVVSEKTSLVLKSRYGLDRLKMVHSRHGAGDRAIGFDKASARFDLVLVSGPKIRDRLIAEAGVDPAKVALVGYVKFDIEPQPVDLGFADPSRPTVLYNPHPSPHLTSWYRFGPSVLRQFAASDRYNLIFAPHVMLFQRRFNFALDRLSAARAVPPGPEFADLPNMHLDLGSARSVDMSYVRAADIYLGDVSSQVYEFLAHPRPCLFLDAHDTDWRGDPNYLHWQAGPVIADASDIIAATDVAVASHPDYLAPQRKLLAATFSSGGRPASERAADAIEALA